MMPPVWDLVRSRTPLAPFHSAAGAAALPASPVLQLSSSWSTTQISDALWVLGRVLIVLVIAWQVARLARYSFERATVSSAADASIRLLVGRVLVLVIIGVGLLTALDIVGVPLSAVVTTLGVVGIAISLAVQDILKNFFAGLYLLFERPFRIGEEIQVKDFRGRVEHVDYRTTIIRTSDNIQVLIPNATLFAEIVLNRSQATPSEPPSPADQPTTDALDGPNAARPS